jgi:hypothetical protein
LKGYGTVFAVALLLAVSAGGNAYSNSEAQPQKLITITITAEVADVSDRSEFSALTSP